MTICLTKIIEPNVNEIFQISLYKIKLQFYYLYRHFLRPPQWSGFLATDPEVPGSILRATRFF
jgi:hypothetical protein